MSGTDIKSMFESIKESLNSDKSTNNTSFRNFLKTEVGNSYLVRFIPNIKDPLATFYHYQHHGFTSLSTGQYVDATCPRSFGERCPICEARFKLYKTKKEEDRNLAYMIRPHEKHLVNVYVVNDPTNSENEGQVKILRFGKRIYDKILDATEGEDASEFGPRIYDLTENGCNFKIKVATSSEGNRKFTNYNDSRFTAPSVIPNLNSEKIQEVYKHVFDLSKVLEIKTENELNEILREHVFCDSHKSDVGSPSDTESPDKSQFEKVETKMKETIVQEAMQTKSDPPIETDQKIKNLLDELDSI